MLRLADSEQNLCKAFLKNKLYFFSSNLQQAPLNNVKTLAFILNEIKQIGEKNIESEIFNFSLTDLFSIHIL